MGIDASVPFPRSWTQWTLPFYYMHDLVPMYDCEIIAGIQVLIVTLGNALALVVM